MMKAIKGLLILLCMGVFCRIEAQPSPLPMLENTASQILNTLKQNKTTLKHNHHVIYQAVEKYLLPNVDVEGMSRSVLGRVAWGQASAVDKQAFTREFTQLVIRTYASPMAEYTDETVRFLPLRTTAEARFVRVNSVIVRSTGQNIPLSYSLVYKNGRWKIYDLSVEGVSLLQSFHSQFNQRLQNASIRELILEMRKKTKAG